MKTKMKNILQSNEQCCIRESTLHKGTTNE